jgi:hypothetical protein
MGVLVEIEGLEEVQRALRKFPAIARPILKDAVASSMASLAKNTLKDDPVPYLTGFLLNSFGLEISGGGLIGRWFPGALYPVNYIEQAYYRSRSPFFTNKIAEKARDQINRIFGNAGDAIAKKVQSSI